MKIATIVIRTLIGLLFTWASIAYFFKLMAEPPMTGNIKTFNEGLAASGYMMPLVKVIELLCGLALLSGRFTALALVLIFPIAVNILFINAFMMPDGLVMAVPLFLGILFLAWVHRKHYAGLFEAKTSSE